MAVDTRVLVHDIRYFVVAYALAIAAAFLPQELSALKYLVAVVLIGIYAWYVKGHFQAEAEEHEGDLPPLRFRKADRRGHPRRPRRAAAAGRQPPGPVRARVHRRRRVPVRRRRGPPRGDPRRERDPARAGHRPDRDGAAREVQLADLGPPGQGHARDGQHHGRDGVPVRDPDGGGARPGAATRGTSTRTRRSRSRPPPSRSSPSPRSSFRCGGGRASTGGRCSSAARCTSSTSRSSCSRSPASCPSGSRRARARRPPPRCSRSTSRWAVRPGRAARAAC